MLKFVSGCKNQPGHTDINQSTISFSNKPCNFSSLVQQILVVWSYDNLVQVFFVEKGSPSQSAKAEEKSHLHLPSTSLEGMQLIFFIIFHLKGTIWHIKSKNKVMRNEILILGNTHHPKLQYHI